MPATLVRPGDAEEVAAVVAWCYAHDVAIVPVGGRSGLAGGAAVVDTGAEAIALSLERLRAVRSFEPELWRMEAEAGVTTATIARLARENGLLFPPDPGAPEQSQLGGTIATNAGGPHAFKYGVTGDWVTGLEAVLAPGELVRVGGAMRKDVAGYDLRALLIGSEGTLGIVTAAWLRFVPAPEPRWRSSPPIPDAARGLRRGAARARQRDRAGGARVLRRGHDPAPRALRFPDGGLGEASSSWRRRTDRGRRPRAWPTSCARRSSRAAARSHAPESARALWRWRDGVSLAVTAAPRRRSSPRTSRCPSTGSRRRSREPCAIGARHDLTPARGVTPATATCTRRSCSTRATTRSARAPTRPRRSCSTSRSQLGGTVTGEHGIGLLKAGQLSRQWAPAAVAAQRAIKARARSEGALQPRQEAALSTRVPARARLRVRRMVRGRRERFAAPPAAQVFASA